MLWSFSKTSAAICIRMWLACSRTSNRSAANVAVETAYGGTFRICVWPQVKAPLRVVRSLETYSVRRQLDRTVTQETSDWVWVTTLPQPPAPTARIVAWGHQRWDIENFGFNELVNGWEADHIYKHEAKAIEAFLLMAFLACNIFHAFLGLNLKPQLRDTKPEKYWACLIAAELYRDAGTTTRKRAP